jgi:hypothetical protein
MSTKIIVFLALLFVANSIAVEQQNNMDKIEAILMNDGSNEQIDQQTNSTT